MSQNGLDLLNASAIKAKLTSLSEERRRVAVLNICELAVRRTELRDPRIEAALRQMREAGYVTPQAMQELEQCYDELDLHQLELNDNPDDPSLHNLYPQEARRSGAALAVLECAQMKDWSGACDAIADAAVSMGENFEEIEGIIDSTY